MNNARTWLAVPLLAVILYNPIQGETQSEPCWVVRPDPVMGPTPPAFGICVRRDGDRYKAWCDDGYGTQNVQYATSSDGLTWSSRETVYTPQQVHDSWPKVVIRDGSYHLWVGPKPSPDNGGFEYVTSPDGINWTKQAYVADPDWYIFSVLAKETGFIAWHMSDDHSGIRLSTSMNGYEWTDNGIVVFPGNPGEYDEILVACGLEVVKVNSIYHMFYNGTQANSSILNFCHATSTDGIAWTKHGPMCGLEDFGSSNIVPSVILDENILKMWFHVSNSNRVWYATLELEPAISVAPLDIKPGSCPNPLNRKSKGKLPVAVLGTDDFDVSEIDLATVLLSRADGVGGSVAPLEGPPGPHSLIEDAGTPFDGDPCDCHEANGDGIMDLSMKFSTPAVVETLELNDLAVNEAVELVVSGSLLDGTPFEASDCVVLKGTTKAAKKK